MEATLTDQQTKAANAPDQAQPAKLPAQRSYSYIYAKEALNLGARTMVRVTYLTISDAKLPHDGQVAVHIEHGFSSSQIIFTPAQCRELAGELIRIADLADAENLAAGGK